MLAIPERASLYPETLAIVVEVSSSPSTFSQFQRGPSIPAFPKDVFLLDLPLEVSLRLFP